MERDTNGLTEEELLLQFWQSEYQEERLELTENHPLTGRVRVFTSKSAGRGRRREPRDVVLFVNREGGCTQLPPNGGVANGVDEFAADVYDGLLAPGEDAAQRLMRDIEQMMQTRKA